VPGGAAGKLKEAAAGFYQRLPTPHERDGIGQALVAAAANKVVEVWPENRRVWDLFMRVNTQWNVGIGGRTGLRYEALYPLLDRMAKSPAEWDSLLEDVQLMESAALEAMHGK
jgi:hypothetical protein